MKQANTKTLQLERQSACNCRSSSTSPLFLRQRRLNRWLGLAIGLFTGLLLLATAADYGLTYDEPVYASRSMRAGEWLGLLLTAPGLALQPETIARLWDATGDEQAGLLKLLAWPLAMILAPFVSPLAAIRAAPCALMGLFIGLMFVFLANMRGRLEAAFACLGLMFMPRVFAHMHLLALDAPVMAFSFLAVAAAYIAAQQQAQQRCRWAMWAGLSGLSFGAAISFKANGWLVPVIVLPWLWMRRSWRLSGAILAAYILFGPLVFIGTWPWLWHNTWERLVRYFSFFAKHYPVGTLYWGKIYVIAPWHYAPVMLAITTPPVILSLTILCVVLFLQQNKKRAATSLAGQPPPLNISAKNHNEHVGLMLWAIVVNMIPWMMPDAPKYNGERLFLPVFPYLAVLAALCFGTITRLTGQRLATSRREQLLIFALLLLLTLAPQIYQTGQFHPYGLSYYNMFISGLPGAVRHGMEPTYWGEAFYAAVPWLNQHASPAAIVWINIPGFVSSIAIYQQFGLLRPDVRLVGGDTAFAEADYYVVMNKPTEWDAHARELVESRQALYIKELKGVPLLWIFGRR